MQIKPLRSAALLVSASVVLGSCAVTPESCQFNQTATGALLGAGLGTAAGAIFGHGNAGAMLAGAAAGAVIGGLIGNANDQACHRLALQQALDQAYAEQEAYEAQREADAAHRRRARAAQPQYQAVAWTNSQTGHKGVVKPLSGYTDPQTNAVCYTVADSSAPGGQTKACKASDGTWKQVGT